LGGFAQFGLAAGTAASVGWKNGGHAGSEAIAAEMRPFAEPSGRAWTNLINASSFCASKLHANGLLSRRVVPLSFAR